MRYSKEILSALTSLVRQELKIRGENQAAFAKRLKISLPTLKRWLAGTGVSLENWLLMLDALDLSLADVLGRVEMKALHQFEYTLAQEEEFCRVPGLLAFYDHLLKENSVEKTALSQKAIASFLKKLDQIGLIRWEEGFRFRLLKVGEPRWRRNGPLAKLHRERIYLELIAAHRSSSDLRIGIYKLLPADAAKIEEILDSAFTAAKIAEQKRKIPGGKIKSFGLVGLFCEYEPEFLMLGGHKS